MSEAQQKHSDNTEPAISSTFYDSDNTEPAISSTFYDSDNTEPAISSTFYAQPNIQLSNCDNSELMAKQKKNK